MKRAKHAVVLLIVILMTGAGGFQRAFAGDGAIAPQEVIHTWYRLVLELVRHTPTYTPPVASRSFGYIGVAAFEAVASGSASLTSLAGQLNGLQPLPVRQAGKVYSETVIVQATMALSAHRLFDNTGPTGQRAMAALEKTLAAKAAASVPDDVVARSKAYGEAIARHILEWASTDKGADIENMGFPRSYTLTKGPAHWVPTNLIALQQTPLLPDWGKNRPFAMPEGGSCPLPAPIAYSEDRTSEFYKEALEVFEVRKNLTPEQGMIARFWADDAMLSPTPPGHWISIAMQILQRDNADLDLEVDVLARLGIALADAFIGCWHEKFVYDLVRPVTYIRRTMDPKWESVLTTPPFPEYPSGHSTQSGAAATVLTQMFGDDFAFEDATHVDDGIPARKFASFWAAAHEAGISRLYGGIHFRAAIERGLDQGRCIGAYVNALRTRM